MKGYLVAVPWLFALSLSACGGSSTSTSLDDELSSTDTPNPPEVPDAPATPDASETPDTPATPDEPVTPEQPATPDEPETPEPPVTPDEPAIPDTPIVLQIPEFRGEVVFENEQRVDLDPLLDSAGLERATNIIIARNGQSIRADLVDDRGALRAIALVDTETLTTELLATDIGDGTALLFDANNKPVAVFGENCAVVSYTPLFDTSVVDLTSMADEGQCLFEEVRISSDGNVLLFYTYPQFTSPFEINNSALRAYTLDTANLTLETDFSVDLEGTTLPPIFPLPFGFEQILSDDGRYFFAQQWWTGTDANGNPLRQVGAILWDTLSGTWQARALTDDLRDCTGTSQVSCSPPYFYAMSSDGERQYFSQPTAERLEIPTPTNTFVATVGFADTDSLQETNISYTGTVRSLDTNTDGDLLLLQAGQESDTVDSGFALYQASSGTLISLNGTINECELLDDNGNSADDSRCVYTEIPFSLTGDGVEFTASGGQVLLRSISRFTATREQSVAEFLLDVDQSVLYTLPFGYAADPDTVNADASVIIGNTDFPDFDVLIGRR